MGTQSDQGIPERTVWKVPSLIYIYISRDLAGNKINTLGTERLGFCMWSNER